MGSASCVTENCNGQSAVRDVHIRKRLHAVTRIHRLGGPDFLCVDGWSSDCNAAEGTGDRAALSNVWLSVGATDLHRIGRIVHCGSRVPASLDFRDLVPVGIYGNSSLSTVETWVESQIRNFNNHKPEI